MVTQMGRSMFLGGQIRPIQGQRRPQRPPNFWDLLHARAQYENIEHILDRDQTRCRVIFTGSTTNDEW